MEKHRYLSKLSSMELSSNRLSHSMILFFILILSLLPTCTKKMSLEEAKQVTVTMSGKSFVPPPRRIDDLLVVLEQDDHFDSGINKKFRAKISQPPPQSATSETLAAFYNSRGEAAMQIGRHNQALADLRLALSYSSRAVSPNHRLLNSLAYAEFACGNFRHAIELFEKSLRTTEWPSTYRGLVKLYARIGDLDSAEKTKKRGIALCNRLRNQRGWGTWPLIHAANMEAYVLEARGKFASAEPHYRLVLRKWTPSMKGQYQMGYIVARVYLTRNLKNQDRLLEAEVEARETLEEAVSVLGGDSEIFGSIIGDLGEILLRQGRLEDAEKLMRASIRTMEEANISSDSYLMADGRIRLGKVLIAKREFVKAMAQFDLARSGMKENQYLYENYFERNPDIILVLLRVGRLDEARELISAVHAKNTRLLGEQHYLTKEILGLRGIAKAMQKNNEEALRDFSNAVPSLLQTASDETFAYDRKTRLGAIAEAYLDVLAQIRGSDLEKDFGINATQEAFKLVDTLSGRTVRGAIGASGARLAVADPDLADLVRREQDALKQINVLQMTLADNVAAPKDQRLPQVIEELKRKVATLTSARNALLDEIKERFPRYSDLRNPQPATISKVQNHLRLSEAFIFIYVTDDKTYVWAIPHKGETRFSTVPITRKELEQIVSELRRALDPEPVTFGDIPEFDITKAYNLYSKLLKPVENGWQGSKDLLIAAHGPLGQLPFAALPTTHVSLGEEEKELFSKYRDVPWFIRELSITRLPSASIFVTLRALPEGDPQRKAFVGFGDPFFSQEQFARAGMEDVTSTFVLASRGGRLHVRGIRVTAAGTLDSEKITSVRLGSLNRLPDTRGEIRSIAKALGADPDRDVFIGERASEKQVKTMDLSDRRVVAFATHALLPGDLDGLDQPALALCAPSVTGQDEDGMLTMGEIMTLKLNADWVVLSACNTGAAHGAGAEAISGLGQAFFYAGTRAILVSMWPVETTSARKLTTGLFSQQNENPNLTRARALRKSMLEVIDGPGMKDEVTGNIVASYAHPIFWAPFIIVGDNGGLRSQ